MYVWAFLCRAESLSVTVSHLIVVTTAVDPLGQGSGYYELQLSNSMCDVCVLHLLGSW